MTNSSNTAEQTQLQAQAAQVGKAPEIRNTKQRRAVTATLETLEDFISAQDLHQLMQARGEKVSLATTYRLLQSMVGSGEVETLKTEEGESIFRRCESDHHHHHLLCRKCGAAREFEIPELENLVLAIAHKNGFTEVNHVIEMTGLCAACADPSAN
ncbi:Fur family transcriptional regulator [Rothia nasimurium]|uniref:Fur family transcriptional regulator n=1 Tax=Rothia nasimurium TaxID=85336 RepID=UPI0023515C61|nr:Fur family transcriptional regulator [Rothia nasimurium]